MKRARILLDELLGPNRNLLNKEKFDDKKHSSVCKYMLIDFCPFLLLKTIKYDYKPCEFTNHEKSFVKLYEESGNPNLEEYELLFLDILKEFYQYFVNKQKNNKNLPKYFYYELRIKEKTEEINKLLLENNKINFNNLKKKAFYILDLFKGIKELKKELNLINNICECMNELKNDLPENYLILHKKGKYHQGITKILKKLNELLIKYNF